jgi:hypothetical protein
MKKQLCLAPFACALFLAAPLPQLTFAQNVIPDIRSAQSDGKAATYITFDVPGTCTSYQFATGIDAAGTVVGYYQDCADKTVYGFYRLADGSIHRFHPEPTTHGGWAASAAAVNADGTIIGSYVPTGGVRGGDTGYLRDHVGNYIEFNPFDSIDTEPEALNSAGVVTGEYWDPAKRYHGFVRDAEGNFTAFDAPGSAKLVQTMPTSIN